MVLVRDNLRGLGRAINAYCDVLRRHREGLEQLRAYAVGRGLDVRGHQIWPPVETIAGDAPQKELDAWERDWKGYRECFETKIELRDTRRTATRELIRALAEQADVHPDKERHQLVASGGNKVSFGELRREAAEEAMEALQAGEAEIQAQAEKVAGIDRDLIDARVDARDAQATAEREQAQANRAARDLEDAESGRPRVVAQAVEWQPPTAHAEPVNLKDRLG